jgi:hypothetical protein
VELFGDEARLLFSPFRRYRELAAERSVEDTGWTAALRRPLTMLLIIGGFVSLTSAGRLVWYHVLFAMIAWGFVPALQILFVALSMRIFGSEVPLRRAIDLFYTGYAPWLFFLLALAGLCAFAPDPWHTFERLLDVGVLFGAFLVVSGWSILLTFAFFKYGLSLGQGRGLGATIAYYTPFAAVIVFYYIVTGQLMPLIGGVP